MYPITSGHGHVRTEKKTRPLHNGRQSARRGRERASSGNDRVGVPTSSLHLLKELWGLFWLRPLLTCTDERVGFQAKGQGIDARIELSVGACAGNLRMHTIISIYRTVYIIYVYTQSRIYIYIHIYICTHIHNQKYLKKCENLVRPAGPVAQRKGITISAHIFIRPLDTALPPPSIITLRRDPHHRDRALGQCA